MSEERLNRIEQKLDRLVDILESIARVEEKQVSTDTRIKQVEFRLNKLERELDKIGKVSFENKSVANFADKFFWVIVGGLVSIAVWLVKIGVDK